MANDWMLVAKPRHWSEEELQSAELVVKNAIRLLDDATLLQTYERWGTAYTLSTIAMEEAGKVALQLWSDDDVVQTIGKSWTYHLKKQAAAACLLMADFAKTTIDSHPARKGMGTFVRGNEEDEAELGEYLAKALHGSAASRLLEHVALHAVERSKHVGLYADDWNLKRGLRALRFTEQESVQATNEARKAIRLLRSEDHVRIAGAVYKTEPLRVEMVAAGKASLRR